MKLRICTIDDKMTVSNMIMELMNYHRKLTNAPKEFWCALDNAKESFDEWFISGKIYLILEDEISIGFFYIKFGGNNAAWLEDLFILEKFRGKGFGKSAMRSLDKMLINDNITALFVDVIPRNNYAIEFYQEVGFDHLNMIQLRKNYDDRLNKTEEVEVLGYRFNKY